MLAIVFVVLVFVGNAVAEDYAVRGWAAFALPALSWFWGGAVVLPAVDVIVDWTREHPVPAAVWIILSPFVLIGLFWLMRALWYAERDELYVENDRLDAKAFTLDGIAELNASLLQAVGSIPHSTDREEALKNTIELMISKWASLFGEHLARAAVWEPRGQFLACIAHHEMPEKSLAPDRFYIGNPDPDVGQPGIAGSAYRSGEVIIARMRPDEEGWRCDDDRFTASLNGRDTPLFRSFIAVPIGGGNEPVLGVLCIDSMEPTMWDDELLQAVAGQLALQIRGAMVVARLPLDVDDAAALPLAPVQNGLSTPVRVNR